MHRPRRMQRVQPKVLIQPQPTIRIEIFHHRRTSVVRAETIRVAHPHCLRKREGVIEDLCEEGMCVEEEDFGVGVSGAQMVCEGSEADVEGRDEGGRGGVGEGQEGNHGGHEGGAVDWGDVEEEESASAGVVELVGWE